MTLTALIITDKQDAFPYYKSAFHTGEIQASHSFFRLREIAHKLVAIQPDILLIETAMGEQAAQLLDYLSRLDLAQKPAAFVCLERRTTGWEQLFLRRGVMYVFDKSMSEIHIVDCITHLYDLYHSAQREEKLFPELVHLLRECGFSPQHRGYNCIVESVQLFCREADGYQSLTKKVYPYVAKRQSTTPVRVEKNIRDAIRHAWEKGDKEAMQRCLGLGSGEKPPSNGRLIHSLCERLRQNSPANRRA